MSPGRYQAVRNVSWPDPSGAKPVTLIVVPKEGFVVWFTGLPGAGKTTLARALKTELERRGLDRVELLDGDELRATPLAHDLGFSKQDRNENVLRVGFVAELLSRNGIFVLVALVSPYEEAREHVRSQIARVAMIHLDCGREELERRDPKGHYARARRGEIAAFTGISDPYEAPSHPDLVIRTDEATLQESVEVVLVLLEREGHLSTITRP